SYRQPGGVTLGNRIGAYKPPSFCLFPATSRGFEWHPSCSLPSREPEMQEDTMDLKNALSRGAHGIWTRKSAATGLKGMAALAVGRWLWGKWQNRSAAQVGGETGDTIAENPVSESRHEEPRAM